MDSPTPPPKPDDERKRTGKLGFKLATKLGETKPEPQKLVITVMRALGESRATELVEQALAIDAGEGMFYERDGVKVRRTPGGIFFRLAYDAGWRRPPPYWVVELLRRRAERAATAQEAPSAVTAPLEASTSPEATTTR